MQRREFIQRSAILASFSVLPWWSKPVWAAERPLLSIPPQLAPDERGNITLTLQTGSMPWRPGVQTRTWGINGGLLAEPVKVSQLPLLMGERFEVLVDARDGQAFDVISQPVTQMGMTLPPFDQSLPVLRIVPTGHRSEGTLPDALSTMPALPRRESLKTRHLQLSMDPRLDAQGMQTLMDRYGMQAMAGMSMTHHGGGGPASGEVMQHGDHQMHHSESMHHQADGQNALNIMTGNRINGAAFMMGHSPRQGACDNTMPLYPSYSKLQVRWLRSFTRITYLSKLIGILSLAAFIQPELFWV